MVEGDRFGRLALTEPGMLLRGLGLSFWHPAQEVVAGDVDDDAQESHSRCHSGVRALAIQTALVDDLCNVFPHQSGDWFAAPNSLAV